MLPHQQRVVVERDDLVDKIGKLAKFLDSTIFYNLHQSEQDRLVRQLSFMNSYAEVLNERISYFRS